MSAGSTNNDESKAEEEEPTKTVTVEWIHPAELRCGISIEDPTDE